MLRAVVPRAVRGALARTSERSWGASSASSRGVFVGRAAASGSEFETVGVVRRRLGELEARVDAALEIARARGLREKFKALDEASAASDLWEDVRRAKALMAELGSVKEELQAASDFETHVDDAKTALELAESGDVDETEMEEMLAEAMASVEALDKALDAWNCDGCWEGNTTPSAPSCPSTPARGGWTLKIGRRCWRECMLIGQKREVSSFASRSD